MDDNLQSYPVTLSIDYKDKLDRFTTFFRIILAIPILFILSVLNGGNQRYLHEGVKFSYGIMGILFFLTLLMILFRQKYPKWWFDFSYAFLKFSTRVASYLLLLRDEYPSTDEEQAIHISLPYPDVKKDLYRGLPLIKWFLAIPHYIILAFLFVAVVIVVFISWFAIVFTERYPKPLFEFVVGVMRWIIRVDAYAFLLVTDKYPPFSLSN